MSLDAVIVLRSIGTYIAQFLSEPRDKLSFCTARPEALSSCLLPGDVLLVEGTSRISNAIKYLTQSSWSHAAIYIGNAGDLKNKEGVRLSLIEADLVEGVRAIPLAQYETMHTRICRPVGLTTCLLYTSDAADE